MKKLFYTIVCLVCFFSAALAQRDTIALNSNWQFAIDKKGNGLNEKWFEKSLPNNRSVNLPHTWNIEDDNQNHYGWGWYQQKLKVRPTGKIKMLYCSLEPSIILPSFM